MPPVSNDPAAPTDVALVAWRVFLEAHAHIIRALEADLLNEQNMPLQHYDVLVQLSEATDRRLRMSELAERTLLSRSGLSRLVDRLVVEQLVVREPCADDARGVEAVLTDAGLQRLQTAWVTHVRGVRELFVTKLAGADVTAFTEALRRLA